MGHIKNYEYLGMNKSSDNYILPGYYMPVEEPHYTGDGNHSVHELQKLCNQYKEYCHQQAIIKSELIKRLYRVYT